MVLRTTVPLDAGFARVSASSSLRSKFCGSSSNERAHRHFGQQPRFRSSIVFASFLCTRAKKHSLSANVRRLGSELLMFALMCGNAAIATICRDAQGVLDRRLAAPRDYFSSMPYRLRPRPSDFKSTGAFLRISTGTSSGKKLEKRDALARASGAKLSSAGNCSARSCALL